MRAPTERSHHLPCRFIWSSFSWRCRRALAAALTHHTLQLFRQGFNANITFAPVCKTLFGSRACTCLHCGTNRTLHSVFQPLSRYISTSCSGLEVHNPISALKQSATSSTCHNLCITNVINRRCTNRTTSSPKSQRAMERRVSPCNRPPHTPHAPPLSLFMPLPLSLGRRDIRMCYLNKYMLLSPPLHNYICTVSCTGWHSGGYIGYSTPLSKLMEV